jgi:hypothetical protein
MWNRTTVLSESDSKGQETSGVRSPTWEFNQAFERMAECTAKSQSLARGWEGAAERAKVNGAEPVILAALVTGDNEVLAHLQLPRGAKRWASWGFVCLPGGVDPRSR